MHPFQILQEFTAVTEDYSCGRACAGQSSDRAKLGLNRLLGLSLRV